MNIDDLKKDFEGVAASALNGVSEDRAEIVRERLYRMIDYAIGRFDWYENERHKFLGIALVAVPILAAQAAYSLELLPTHGPSGCLGVISALLGILFALAMIYVYVSASEVSHPYRKLVDIRSWYFRYSLPGKLEAKLNRNPDKAAKQVECVLEAYKDYTNRWAELLQKETAFIAEDLQQVFILHLLQKHRQENLNRLVGILKRGTIVYTVFFVAAIVFYTIE